jgi:UDP-4-amino-4,6-dideoxy-N-acetyl-beta-L-altrosamine transaminase
VTTPIPYGRQWIQEDDIEAVVQVLRSDWLTTGPVVDQFEASLAEKLRAKYAVVVSSGTAALHLACLAAGVGPGDVVISSPNTFAASTNCALYCGARPAFVDIDARTYNLDPDALLSFLSRRKTDEKVRALIPVHFAGQPCDMERISRAAREAHLVIIEDACHALGARWQDSQGEWHRVGSCSHSDMAVLSFHPVKHITTGEGGAIMTNRPDLHAKLKQLRNHGISKDLSSKNGNGAWYYELDDLGFNYRLTDLQCALGISQLRKLDGWVERRREIAATYDQLLGQLENVGIPYQAKNTWSSYHLYVIQVPSRRRIFETLRARCVGVQVHYVPVHLHPIYRTRFGFRPGDFPAAENYYEHAISLPIFPRMSDADKLRVVHEVKAAVESR